MGATRSMTGPVGGGSTGSPARAAERPPRPTPTASARITRIGDVRIEGIGAIYLIPADGATSHADTPARRSSRVLGAGQPGPQLEEGATALVKMLGAFANCGPGGCGAG